MHFVNNSLVHFSQVQYVCKSKTFKLINFLNKNYAEKK